MLSDRPYGIGMTKQKALDELKLCSGTQFDPEFVEVFIKIMGNVEQEII